MPVADFVCKQGDTNVTLTATLLDATGNPVNLTGGSVTVVARAQTAIGPMLNTAATIVNAAAGQVLYQLKASDTASTGLYMVEWHYTLAGGAMGTWPVDGWQELKVEDNLVTPGGQRIVGLTEVREHLRLDSNDRSRDQRLLQMIDGLTPVIENMTGPVIQRVVTETYDGGTPYVSLRRRPVLEVHEVTEYRGPIPYRLQQVPTPDVGTIYSYEFQRPGRLVRRTVGGGVTAFPPGYDSVYVTYTCGYLSTPPDIREAVLEVIRDNYELLEQGRLGPVNTDANDVFRAANISFYVSPRVQQMLIRHRRHPAIA